MQIKNKTVKNIIKGIENVKGENINIIDFTKLENRKKYRYFYRVHLSTFFLSGLCHLSG